MPGYRLRLPERVHPISAGIKGGLVGGLVMPLPAMIYGVLSGHGIWMPINLLAGMALPGVDELSVSELEQFRPTLFALGAGIHVTVSLILGLLYGVLMPTLPKVPKPLAWGALLMPLLWTAASFVALGVFNPSLRAGVDWPWFVVSQFIFGVVAALVFMRSRQRSRITAGLQGGIAGGLLMPLPALLWGWLTKHGIWYPINLLAAMAMPHAGQPPVAELEQFHADWLFAAIVVHAIFSISFGLAYGIVLPRMPEIPAPMAWGGLVMPMLWTASSYGLMGVLNPALQEFVDWPWFVVSQFVFGVVAATVVVRSEQMGIPPAGRGTDHSADYLTR
jgi:small basic protein